MSFFNFRPADVRKITITEKNTLQLAHDSFAEEVRADGKPAWTLYMALSIDFHLHYINDLKNS